MPSVNGHAVMRGIVDQGLYVDPVTSEKKVQISIDVAYIGDDSTVATSQVDVILGALDLVPSTNIRAAMVSDAASKGYTINTGNALVYTVTKV